VQKKKRYSIQNRERQNNSCANNSEKPSSPDKLQSAQSYTRSKASGVFVVIRKEKKRADADPFFFVVADFYGFFFHSIPEPHEDDEDDGSGGGSGVLTLTLSELHELVANVWLTRHDAELEEERTARRKGRPKSTREQKLEEIKLREAEEYRTGMGESLEFIFSCSLRCMSCFFFFGRGTGFNTS
jgi:translation machinery-associated protein 16